MQQALKCKLNTRLLRLRRSDTSMTGHESHESRGENVGEFLTSVERGLTIIGSSRYLRDLIHWAERQAGPRAAASGVSFLCRMITINSCLNHAVLQNYHF